MSELEKWRVTGPDGFKTSITSLAHEDAEHVAVEATRSVALTKIVRQAGYRAEPIEEEAKMVTVLADDVSGILEDRRIGSHDCRVIVEDEP